MPKLTRWLTPSSAVQRRSTRRRRLCRQPYYFVLSSPGGRAQRIVAFARRRLALFFWRPNRVCGPRVFFYYYCVPPLQRFYSVVVRVAGADARRLYCVIATIFFTIICTSTWSVIFRSVVYPSSTESVVNVLALPRAVVAKRLLYHVHDASEFRRCRRPFVRLLSVAVSA